MYLVFTRMPGESYRRRLRSLSSQVLINSLVCWFCTRALGLVLFQIFSCTPTLRISVTWSRFLFQPYNDEFALFVIEQLKKG